MKPGSRKTLSRWLATAVAFAALSCTDRSTTTSPRAIAPGDASRVISDGAHGGNDDIWFLPPMVTSPVGQPGYGDPFAPGLPVVIKVLDVSQNKVLTGVTATTMSLADEQYQANWDTKNSADNNPLADTYEVQVFIGSKKVAWADANLVSSGSQVKNASGDIVTLPDGRTLPMKVRIEQGWNCNNNSTCVTQQVPATIPPGTTVTVKTNDGKDYLILHGTDGTGTWNTGGVSAIVTIEDVSSQVSPANTPQGCAQGLTRMVVDGHCIKITTDPTIILTTSAVVCMTLPSFQTDWKLLKYNVGETTKFLDDPPAGVCPGAPPTIGSTSRSSNPLVRLASRVGNTLRDLITPRLAYAFDLGVGGTVSPGDGFSFFAAGRPAQMVKVAGDNQTALSGSVLPIAPQVQILTTHHHSVPVGGAVVTCTVTAGGGTIAAASSGPALEGPTGTYTCPSWTLGATAGTNTLKVTANILDTLPTTGTATFTATGSPTCPTICITSLTPSSTNVILESADPITTYTAVLHNATASAQSGPVFVQGMLVQGTAKIAAGGTNVTCPSSATGTLPIGDCTMSSVISASNLNGGSGGPLVAGPARFLLELIQGAPGTVVDTMSVAVNLQGARAVGVAVAPTVGIVDIGSTLPITTVVTAAPGVSTAVDWASTNTAVATVDASGVVTGVAAGSATITARSRANVAVTGSTTITVQAAGTGTFIGSFGIDDASPVLPSNPSGQWVAIVANPSGALTLQGEWIQGNNSWAAGGTTVTCPATGPCVVRFPYATQISGSVGPLVPGPATLRLTLINDATSAALDSKSIAVTLVSP
jgi:hypothetical protein